MKSSELKKITEQFTLEQIEQCIGQQLAKGENSCNVIDESDRVITALSKATVVRELLDQGMDFHQALRELGKRIRAVYSSDDRQDDR